jgi:uncharacterized protein (TIGR02270 family)
MVAKLSEVVTQHAEETSFLWSSRAAAVRQADCLLADLTRFDQRLEAHLDGLRVNGDAGWQLCRSVLDEGEPAALFAAGVLAFESRNDSRVGEVLKAGTASTQCARVLVSSLGWLRHEQAFPFIQSLLSASQSSNRHIGIAASAIHRCNPGGPLRDATSDADTLLRSRALKAVGELGCADLLSKVRAGLGNPDPNVRFAAAWSAALLSLDADATSVLRTISESPVSHREGALTIAIRRMDFSTAKSWQASLAKKQDTLRLAIAACGAVGDPELIPWLITQMKVPALARPAGEALSMITAVHIPYDKLEGEWPEGFEAGPNEDPKDENVEMDPDENLPWPNPDLVQKWWEKNKGHFQSGVRYLCGKPMTIDWLKIVLRDGFQRQRAAAALELAIRQPGTPLFNVKAPGFRQIELLGKPKGPIRGPDHAG